MSWTLSLRDGRSWGRSSPTGIELAWSTRLLRQILLIQGGGISRAESRGLLRRWMAGPVRHGDIGGILGLWIIVPPTLDGLVPGLVTRSLVPTETSVRLNRSSAILASDFGVSLSMHP